MTKGDTWVNTETCATNSKIYWVACAGLDGRDVPTVVRTRHHSDKIAITNGHSLSNYIPLWHLRSKEATGLYITYSPDHRAISSFALTTGRYQYIALWLGQNLISLCSQGYTWHHPGLYRADSHIHWTHPCRCDQIWHIIGDHRGFLRKLVKYAQPMIVCKFKLKYSNREYY